MAPNEAISHSGMRGSSLEATYFRYCFAKDHASWLKAVDFSILPRRPFYLGWLGLSESGYRAMILPDLIEDAHRVNRPLSPIEKKALLPIHGQRVLAVAHAIPCAVLGSGYLTWRGRHTYRFPLYSPRFKRFHPDFFPIARSWTPIRGAIARSLWHSVRFFSYTVLVGGPASILLAKLSTFPGLWRNAGNVELDQYRLDWVKRIKSNTAENTRVSDQQLMDKYERLYPDVGVAQIDSQGRWTKTLPKPALFALMEQLAAESTGRFTMDEDDLTSKHPDQST